MTDQFFTDYLERLEDLHRHIHEAVHNLPVEALDWVPGSEMNSVAVLLAHTAGSLRYWIGDVASSDPSGRVRQREFQTKGLTAAEMLGNLDAAFNYARSALANLSLNDLEKVRYLEPGDKAFTCGWALLHALEHGYLHLGHIELTCQLWRQKSNP